MFIFYNSAVFLVIVLLLSIPLSPFWKVWKRLKTHHPEIWNVSGPFDFLSLMATPRCLDSFLEVISMVESDEEIKQSDPYLVKWCVMAQEVWDLVPKSFLGQLFYFILFFCFTGILTSVLLKVVYIVLL